MHLFWLTRASLIVTILLLSYQQSDKDGCCLIFWRVNSETSENRFEVWCWQVIYALSWLHQIWKERILMLLSHCQTLKLTEINWKRQICCQKFDITVQIISLISVRFCQMWLLKTTKIPQIKMITFKMTNIIFAHYWELREFVPLGPRIWRMPGQTSMRVSSSDCDLNLLLIFQTQQKGQCW